MSIEAMRNAVEAMDKHDFEMADHILCQAIAEAEKQEQGKPVAYLCENAVGHKYFRWKKPTSTYKPIALYTTPQQRTWEGLSVFEINDLVENTEYEDYHTLVETVEAKLKEKNT